MRMNSGRLIACGLQRQRASAMKYEAGTSSLSLERKLFRECETTFADEMGFPPGSRGGISGGSAFYAEGDPTLALKFLDTVEDAIRCCLTHVFPYAVFFTIEPESIPIVAVMHCSREPGYWKRRVPQS
jgi:hypothetical protein